MRVHTEWILTPWRLAFHEPTQTAVVADLHLGYEQARRQSGEAVPLVDLKETLVPLHLATRVFGFHRLIIAGDLFEKGFCRPIWQEFSERMKHMGIDEIAVVPGN